MTYVEAQLFAVFSQVLYRHAEIVSGGYKLRDVEQGCGRNDDGTIAFRPLSDDEKLKYAMQIMQVQIERLNEVIEAIANQPAKRREP